MKSANLLKKVCISCNKQYFCSRYRLDRIYNCHNYENERQLRLNFVIEQDTYT